MYLVLISIIRSLFYISCEMQKLTIGRCNNSAPGALTVLGKKTTRSRHCRIVHTWYFTEIVALQL